MCILYLSHLLPLLPSGVRLGFIITHTWHLSLCAPAHHHEAHLDSITSLITSSISGIPDRFLPQSVLILCLFKDATVMLSRSMFVVLLNVSPAPASRLTASSLQNSDSNNASRRRTKYLPDGQRAGIPSTSTAGTAGTTGDGYGRGSSQCATSQTYPGGVAIN